MVTVAVYCALPWMWLLILCVAFCRAARRDALVKARLQRVQAEPEPEAAVAYTDGTVVGDRVIVLMTTTGGPRLAGNLRMILAKLAQHKVRVEQVDGSDPDNKARREALWKISEKCAVYHQVFVQVGSGAPVFVSAGADDFEDMSDGPFPSLAQALAPLLGAGV